MIEAVVDINVFISSLIGGRITGKLYQALQEERYRLILSDEMFGELIDVLSRPKFGLTESDIEKVKTFLRLNALFVKPSEKISICRDPKDNVILECAVASKSRFIVTGDKDLLDIKSFRNIHIITPKEFLNLLKF